VYTDRTHETGSHGQYLILTAISYTPNAQSQRNHYHYHHHLILR